MTPPNAKARELAERFGRKHCGLINHPQAMQELAQEITALMQQEGERLIKEFASKVEIMEENEKNRTFLINWMRGSFTLSDEVVQRIGRVWMHKLGLDPDNPRGQQPAQGMSDEELGAMALESGFMLSTMYGQEANQLMPVSDFATIKRFADNLAKAYKDGAK